MVVHELQIHKNIRNHNEVFWFSFLVHSKLIASSNILFRSSKSFSFINIFTVGLDYSRQSQLLMGRRIVSWSTSWPTSFLPMKQKIFGITLFIYWNHSYACKINNVIQDYAHKKVEIFCFFTTCTCKFEIAFFKLLRFIAGCISTLASNPWNKGSAIVGIISGLGKSKTSTIVLFPFTFLILSVIPIIFYING